MVQLKPSKKAGRRGGAQPLSSSPWAPRGLITPDLSPSSLALCTTSLSAYFIQHSLPCVLGSLIIRIPLNKSKNGGLEKLNYILRVTKRLSQESNPDPPECRAPSSTVYPPPNSLVILPHLHNGEKSMNS